MKNLSTTIMLSEYYAEAVSNRESVRLIFDKLPNVDFITIDFSDIVFISRAAAHELTLYLEKFQNRGKSISLANVSQNVNQMIETVAQSKKVDYKKSTFVERIIFKTDEELESYLFSV
ncbi:STAS domain-containing protein [Litoribacter populi]|uniref:STAS domain-containing protein n=1 Tax=Litoribacter populi TaxID=2598460 RepID=UPI00117FC9FE|nr:STAS domain-containing protein [Litoribacter populi]